MAAPSTQQRDVTLSVQGMTCAACQARVQNALRKTEGVADAQVNLLLNNAAIRFDPRVVTAEQLVERVRDTGYDAELPKAAAHVHEHEPEDRALVVKTAVSLVLAGVCMLLSTPL